MRMSLEDRQLLDRMAIRELVARAADAANHQQFELMEAFFPEDATWERLPPSPWVLKGRKEVMGFLEGNRPKLDVRVFAVQATSVELLGSGDEAVARSTMSEILRFKESGQELHVVGTYHDRFEKRDGRWWITRRTFEPRFERILWQPFLDEPAEPNP